jgi:peptidoglycan/LPS O-acetylase OafA/YrhL
VTITYRTALHVAIGQDWIAAGSVLAEVVLPNAFLGRWSEFGLGMVAAELHRRGRLPAVGWRLGLTVTLAGSVALLAPDNPVKHTLLGVVFAGLLCGVLAGDNVVARVFSWRPIVGIGVMSYSLYLVHQPLVEVVASALRSRDGAGPAQVFLGLVLFLPVLLAAAWALFVTVERRSLGTAGSTGRSPQAPASAASNGEVPAPRRNSAAETAPVGPLP